jgi:tRNA(Ile)-lysidine synthase
LLSGSRALSVAQVDALFAPFEDAERLLIAVSGGPDSTTLLLMAAEWAERRGATRIEAATVDHGLRPDSAAEASGVAALCEGLGLNHRTLVWKGAKPSTRLQERAREARYRLLIAHARACRADALMTAHHADDQAETVLLRLLRGSGVGGLRGIDERSARDGVVIARPLLSVSKAELIAFVQARGVAYVDDPSNADPRFARTRLRAMLGEFAREGLDARALARLARRAGEADEALTKAAADCEARLGATGEIDANALYEAPIAIVQRILSRRIAAAGGRDPSRVGLEKIEALAARLKQALNGRRAIGANVGGAIARLDAKGRLTFAPEPPRRSAAALRVPRREAIAD